MKNIRVSFPFFFFNHGGNFNFNPCSFTLSQDVCSMTIWLSKVRHCRFLGTKSDVFV